MNDEIDNIRSIVKKEIQKKYGQGIFYAKDCQILSDSILKKTNRQISVSTLKRFFGIINYPFNPSNYTFDTLAIFLNYESWNDFLNNFDKKEAASLDQDYWDKLKNRVQLITNQSLKSIKANIGEQLTIYPVRNFAIKKFETFLHSPQTATAFIAPGGYGKTTIVTQLTEMFFTGENAKYPDDIVCLVDGSILVNMLDLNLEIIRIQNIIDYDPKKSFSVFFRKNPDQVKGRFVLIIESLYEIYYQEEKLKNFVENLMDIISSYKGIAWFKILITCRPDNWKVFMNLIKKNPKLPSQWFDVSFEGSMADTINIPLLSNNEIKYCLEKNNSPISYENLKFHYPEITELINNPYLLYLFSLSQNPEEIHTDIELLNQFIKTKVLTEPYLEEKSKIINSFLYISDYAKQNAIVKKDDIPAFTDFNLAYKELIFNNILYEYTVPGSYLSSITYVKFSNNILLEFFLANKWMEENKFNLGLFRRVFKFYKDNNQLQTNILKYLIKFAFKESNTDILKNIFSVFESENNLFSAPETIYVNPEIINVIGIELRNKKELRDLLIPIYAKSKLGQLLYFESFFDMDSLVLHSGDNIDFYLENKHTDDAFIYGHFLKFMQYFLAGDKPKCKKEYEFFQSFALPDNIKPILAGYYYGTQVIYQSVFMDNLDSGLMDKICKKSEMFYKSGIQTITSNPIFEHVIIYSLNYGNKFTEICQLRNLMLDKYEMVQAATTWHNQLSGIIYARALLNTGEVKKAISLNKQVEIKSIPVNCKYYAGMRFNLVKSEFLIFEKKYNEAKQLLEEVKSVSKMIRYKFFYDKALMFENKICSDTF